MKKLLAFLAGLFMGIGKFFTDVFQDFENHWDPKPIFGVAFLIFAGYYIVKVRPGDSTTFLAIAGIGLGLLGWASSPWGAGDPRKPAAQIVVKTDVTSGGEGR